MEEAIEEFVPNLILYNAGTDVLINDPLGGLDISEDVSLFFKSVYLSVVHYHP